MESLFLPRIHLYDKAGLTANVGNIEVRRPHFSPSFLSRGVAAAAAAEARGGVAESSSRSKKKKKKRNGAATTPLPLPHRFRPATTPLVWNDSFSLLILPAHNRSAVTSPSLLIWPLCRKKEVSFYLGSFFFFYSW